MIQTLLIGLFILISNFAVTDELSHFTEVRRLLEEEAVFLNTKLGFNIFGCGGSFVNDISTLELTVEVPGRLELPRARMMFVGALQDWINRVNGDKRARPFYKNFPMTVNNFEFRMILGEYEVKSHIDEPSIAFIFNNGDTVVYCYRKETGGLAPFYRETFAEALKILENRKSKRY